MNRAQLRAIASSKGLGQYNRTTDRVEVPPARARIGDRDPMTGKDEVIYPDGGKEIAGIRLFNSSVPSGSLLSASRAPSSSAVILDGKIFKAEEETPAAEPLHQPAVEGVPWYLEVWATYTYILGDYSDTPFTAFHIQEMMTGQKDKPELLRRYTYTGQNFIFKIESTVLEFKLKSGTILSSYNFSDFPGSNSKYMPQVYYKLISGTPTNSTRTVFNNWRLVRKPKDYWLATPNYLPAPT